MFVTNTSDCVKRALLLTTNKINESSSKKFVMSGKSAKKYKATKVKPLAILQRNKIPAIIKSPKMTGSTFVRKLVPSCVIISISKKPKTKATDQITITVNFFFNELLCEYSVNIYLSLFFFIIL